MLRKLSPSIERDQANTYKAIERFTFLKNRYPDSPYAKDADAHVKSLTKKLASREFYIGEFYYKWGKYNASIIRLEYFLEKYPEAKDRDKALYYLAQDYQELHNPEKAQGYLDRLKQEYPKSMYVRGVKREERKTLEGCGRERTRRRGRQRRRPHRPAASDSISYEERTARQIDLRPAEPPRGERRHRRQPGQRATDGSGARSPKLMRQGKAAAPVDRQQGTSVGTGGGRGEKRRGKDRQPKKTGDKKDSLGFFTEKKPVDVVADTMEGLEKGRSSFSRAT